ncbi:MAG: alpha/beta hydrolase [Chloroflexota bacterium]
MPKLQIGKELSIFYSDNTKTYSHLSTDHGEADQDDSKPPILILIHGAGGTHIHWPAELRTLSSGFVYALDLPGHGRSDPPGRTTVDAYADDVMAFVEALDFSAQGLSDRDLSGYETSKEKARVVLVGHSMGGAIAQVIGIRNPEWLAGLVLVGTSARLPVTDIILDGLLKDFPKTVNFIMKMCWSGPYVQAIRIALAGREMRKISPEVVHGDFVACNGFDVRRRLGEVSVPTLVISGSDDKMTPQKFGRSLADAIPSASLEVMPKSGHMMALEYPLELTALVEQFMNKFVSKMKD